VLTSGGDHRVGVEMLKQVAHEQGLARPDFAVMTIKPSPWYKPYSRYA
jgi:hypothetical protein